MPLALNSVAHLLVDAVCACTLFGSVKGEGDFLSLLFLYNTLAFSTQCLVGLAADRIKKHPLFASLAELLVILGFFLPAPAAVKVLFIGVGNSVFHVAGGAMTLEASREKAAPLGVFVAPGAIGLTLGTLHPFLGKYFAFALFFAALTRLVLIKRFSRGHGALPVKSPALSANKKSMGSLAFVLLLSASAFVRAIGGSAVAFSWKTTQLSALVLTLFVFAGKTLGGFVCDRLGARRAALVSIPLAAVMTAFFADFAAPSLIGQLALNLTMPITLYLMYRAMPDSPAFAFGLAASALWPGTIVGKLFTLTGPALWVFVLMSFSFGLFAILFTEKRIRAYGFNNQKYRKETRR